MPVTSDLIDDPIKGIAFANEMINKYRMWAEEARLRKDFILASKYDFYLTKWADILQHFIREAHQEGKTSTELTTSLNKPREKRRYNANAARARADSSLKRGTVGVGSPPRGMGMEESLRLAKRGSALPIEENHNELLTAERKINDSGDKDAPQGDNDPELADSDSS